MRTHSHANYGKTAGVKQRCKQCTCTPQTTSGERLQPSSIFAMINCVLPGIVASCPSEEEYWSLFKLALLITIYERVCCVLWHIVFLCFGFFLGMHSVFD